MKRDTIFFALLGYLWMFAAAGGLSAADRLYRIHYADSTHSAIYALSACGVFLLGFLWVILFKSGQSSRAAFWIILSGLAIYAATLPSVCLGLTDQISWLWYGLRIFSYIFFAAAFTGYWLLVDYYHLYAAKGLFLLFSLALYAGYVSADFLFSRGFVTTESMLVLVVVILCAATALAKISELTSDWNDKTEHCN